MSMDPEERRLLVIEGIREYMKEIGLSDNTRALFTLIAENVLFPPAPALPTLPRGAIIGPLAPYPGAPGFPTLPNAWAREDRPAGVRRYLNVVKLYDHAVDITVGSKKTGTLTVIVEDDAGEEWTLESETALAFLQHATARGMFDQDDSPPEEIAGRLAERKQQLAEFERAMQTYAPSPAPISTADMEKAFGAHPSVEPRENDLPEGDEETIG